MDGRTERDDTISRASPSTRSEASLCPASSAIWVRRARGRRLDTRIRTYEYGGHMHVSEVGEESELAPETRGREGKREREGESSWSLQAGVRRKRATED